MEMVSVLVLTAIIGLGQFSDQTNIRDLNSQIGVLRKDIIEQQIVIDDLKNRVNKLEYNIEN